MQENARLLPSVLTVVKPPQNAQAKRAAIAIERLRPRIGILTSHIERTGPKIPTVEEIE